MKHVLICGAGAVGLCSALFLRERGYEVTVLERDSTGGDGCSFGNAGMVVPSHFTPLAAPGAIGLGLRWLLDPGSPFYIRPRLDLALASWILNFVRAANRAHVERAGPILRDMLLASRELYEQLADRCDNGFGLAKRGMLILCQTRSGLEEETRAARRARDLDLPVEIVSSARAADLDPDIGMEIIGAAFYPLDCHLDPRLLMRKLTELAVGAGVTLRWSTPIDGWRTDGARVTAAVTSLGDVAADEFVLAAGSWSSELARSLGCNLPLQGGKGYSFTVPNPAQLPRLPSILSEAHVAVTPMGTSLRIGGTMEFAGLDRSISERRTQAIAAAAARYFPALRAQDIAQVRPWAGLRPCSPDGLPYIGRFARYSNLCVAAGHAMLGISLAPITGQLVAQILSGEQPRVAIEPLTPQRYQT
ncbi:MAG TPA: FAD-dependent oxidoreductase [Steroidobacteraceae bacterium]|jgi:D-amino-acid dehydrogenase|nr:FAD-dependent oxidoreductase [Steroidobacteraceae bacterium]